MFIYTAYLDESGTHDGSPVTVMGGILARADQWRDFEKRFTAVRSQYGFSVWHSKKFKKKAGDFRGWTDEKCQALYWSMMNVTAFGLTDVVSISLDNASYEANYKAGATLPRRARLDTKYGLCFRYCPVHFVAEVAAPPSSYCTASGCSAAGAAVLPSSLTLSTALSSSAGSGGS